MSKLFGKIKYIEKGKNMAEKIVDRVATGAKIKEIMDNKGICLAEFAFRMNKSTKVANNYLQGKGLNNIFNVVKISEALDVKIDDFIIKY